MSGERCALVDVDGAAAPCFGLADELGAQDTGWHTHNRHQLLYAVAGALHLQVASAQWLLPPQRAAFIGAHTAHRVACRSRVSLRTVYLLPEGPSDHDCCVFPVTPLAREMILYAMRWGPDWTGAADAAVAAAYFNALSLLARDWITAEIGLRLPRPKTEDLQAAFEYALEHLDSASMADAARAAGVSGRTLARRFQSETQMSWRSFLRTARVLRAMELLAQPGIHVTEVAFAVGFDNVGAFSTSFRELTGEAPSGYQKRVTGL